MKSFYLYSSTASFLLLFSACNTATLSKMSNVSIFILFALLIACFIVMFFLILKVRRQEDRKMSQYVNSVHNMLTKYELPEQKIKELNILISRIKTDKQYAKNESWRNKILAKTYLFLATTYFKAGDENNTLDICSKIIELDPDDAMTLYNRGALYLNREDYLRAIDDFTASLKIANGYASAYNNRGMAYERLNRMEEAFNDYKMALEMEESAIIYFNLGNIHYKLNDTESAKLHYMKALELCDKNDNKLKKEIELGLSILHAGKDK